MRILIDDFRRIRDRNVYFSDFHGHRSIDFRYCFYRFHSSKRITSVELFAGCRQINVYDVTELLLRINRDSDSRVRSFFFNPFMLFGIAIILGIHSFSCSADVWSASSTLSELVFTWVFCRRGLEQRELSDVFPLHQSRTPARLRLLLPAGKPVQLLFLRREQTCRL